MTQRHEPVQRSFAVEHFTVQLERSVTSENASAAWTGQQEGHKGAS